MEYRREKVIGYWLLIGVGILLVQIFLGGITRLTGSGLSITEWDAIMGFIPPLNQQDWETAFKQYQQFDQYRLVNSTMQLNDFKEIFFWEYTHRLWARFMALCAFIPMVYFIIRKILLPKDIGKLMLVIILGGLEGLMGWIMVASGLEENKVLVNPVKLMGHLLIAALLVGLTFRFAIGYLYPTIKQQSQPIKKWVLLLIILLFIQIGFGALVAGSKAAINCTTFPLMNGSFIPDNLGIHQPYEDFIHENNVTLQFIHRNIAYSIAIMIIILVFLWSRHQLNLYFHAIRKFVLLLIVVQISLGVLTLYFTRGSIPLLWAELHQIVAFLLFLSTIAWHYFTTNEIS